MDISWTLISSYMYQIVSICYNHPPMWTKKVESSCRGFFRCRDALYRTRNSSPPLKCVPSVDARRNAGSPRPFPDLGSHDFQEKRLWSQPSKNRLKMMETPWWTIQTRGQWIDFLGKIYRKNDGFCSFFVVSTPILMFIHLWGFKHHNNAFHTWANGNSESTVESLAAG